MKIIYSAVIFAISLAILPVVNATSPSLGGMLGGSSSGTVSAEDLVKKYITGAQQVLQSESDLLRAVGEKTLADKAAASANSVNKCETD